MKLSRCRIAVLCCLLIAPMLLASCARRGAGEAETATQRAEYTGNRTDLWDEEKNPPYTGDAWVPPGGDNEPENPDPDEPEEPEQPDDPEDLPGELPDFDGAEMIILTGALNLIAADWMADEYIYSEDPIPLMLYKRNLTVENLLNVAIQTIQEENSSLVSILRNSILADQRSYHVASLSLDNASVLAGEGLYMNLYDLPQLQLTRSWWNQNFNESAEINGMLPMATGAISPSLYKASYVVLFNEDVLPVNELNDVVKSGDWTMEMFHSFCTLYSEDLSDNYLKAAVGSVNAIASGFRHGCEVELTAREQDGAVFLRGLEERTVVSMQALSEIWMQSAFALRVSSSYSACEAFRYRQAAFLIGQVADIELLASNTNIPCGFLPMPKYDSEQTEYRTGAAYSHGTVAVPAYPTCPDAKMIGLVLEMMCAANVEDILPCYFSRNAFSPEDVELLESLQQMLRWDFSDVYYGNLGNTYWETAFWQNSSISSVYAAERSLMEERLNKLQS